jgi:hypothetical protein
MALAYLEREFSSLAVPAELGLQLPCAQRAMVHQ